MNLYTEKHEICGKFYTEIQLLKLAGVHGIHRDLKRSDRIKLVVSPLGNDGALLTIDSPSIMTLQVAIYPNQKQIENIFMVLFNTKSGLGYSWVEKQTDFASKFDYNALTCTAQRDDSFKCKIDNIEYLIPIIGYKIWMKLGYVMATKEMPDFKKFLFDNSKQIDLTIFELVKTEKEFWVEKGYDWVGEFDLKLGSNSRIILNEYRASKLN